MSKAFIADVIKQSATLTGAGANRAATDLMAAIVKELKKAGKTVRFRASPTLKKAVRLGSPPGSNVHFFDAAGVLLDELEAQFRLAAHQAFHHPVSLGAFFRQGDDLKQGALFRVHGGFL